jgi:hypothetical protein
MSLHLISHGDILMAAGNLFTFVYKRGPSYEKVCQLSALTQVSSVLLITTESPQTTQIFIHN